MISGARYSRYEGVAVCEIRETTMSERITTAEIAEAHAWARSENGQRAIREATERAVAEIAELQRARRIDPARLREPVTR
jgi:hypothetical protein